jgi:hypothetical protein
MFAGCAPLIGSSEGREVKWLRNRFAAQAVGINGRPAASLRIDLNT